MAISGRRYLLASLGGIAVVGAAVSGVGLLHPRVDGVAASLSGRVPNDCVISRAGARCAESASSPTPPARHPMLYRDGDYTAGGDYLTPGGNESIGVSLTLRDGVVVATAVHVEAKSPTARQFQAQFAARYATRAVGRRIADLHLSRVAGASLTSIGFDGAITRIEEDARD